MTTSQKTDEPLAVHWAERIAAMLEKPWLRIAIPIVITGIALTVLHDLSAHVKWSDVQTDITATSWKLMFIALCWTGFSFFSLSLYDVFAVQSVAEGKVPLHVAGMAGASGYAVSNCLGFSYITGTAIRYRIYASLGLDLGRVAGVIATSWVAFWMGLILILGLLLTLHPDGISKVVPVSTTVETAIGLSLLGALVVLFVWLSSGGRRLSLAGVGFDLPGGKLASLLTLAAIGDLFGASMVLYVLMPDDLGVGYPYFFTIYVAAIAVGILSHAPGGIGVFEATLIAGLGASGRSDVIAALLLYRVVYTFLPFAVASLSIAVASALTQRHRIGGAATWVYRVIRPMVPIVAAGVAAVAGVILLVSGALPAGSQNLVVLKDVLPLSLCRGLTPCGQRHWCSAIAGVAWPVSQALPRMGGGDAADGGGVFCLSRQGPGHARSGVDVGNDRRFGPVPWRVLPGQRRIDLSPEHPVADQRCGVAGRHLLDRAIRLFPRGIPKRPVVGVRMEWRRLALFTLEPRCGCDRRCGGC